MKVPESRRPQSENAHKDSSPPALPFPAKGPWRPRFANTLAAATRSWRFRAAAAASLVARHAPRTGSAPVTLPVAAGRVHLCFHRAALLLEHARVKARLGLPIRGWTWNSNATAAPCNSYHRRVPSRSGSMQRIGSAGTFEGDPFENPSSFATRCDG